VEKILTNSDSGGPGVFDFWLRAAERELDEDGLRPTARDPYLQDCVEHTVLHWLYPEATLLDIGCGDGGSTIRFATRVSQAHGCDYVPRFVERARDAALEKRQDNCHFHVASVLDMAGIRALHKEFDIAVTIRCLINLNGWDAQKTAISEIAKCIRPGGLFIASEGWAEGFSGLNLRRQRVGLAAMSVARYNQLISRANFEQECRQHFELVAYSSLGLYLFLSRVLQPVVVAPAAPTHTHPMNKAAAHLQMDPSASDAFTDCDYAGVYVWRRREFG